MAHLEIFLESEIDIARVAKKGLVENNGLNKNSWNSATLNLFKQIQPFLEILCHQTP